MKNLALHGIIEVGRIYLRPHTQHFIIQCGKCDGTYEKTRQFQEHLKQEHVELCSNNRRQVSQRTAALQTITEVKIEEPEIVLIADAFEVPTNEKENELTNDDSDGVKNEQEVYSEDDTNELKSDGEQQSILEIEPLPAAIVIQEHVQSSDLEENAVEQFEQSEERSKQPRIFYNLRSTDPKIMLHFIKLIERNPCHWDIGHEFYGTRIKRQESAALIEQQLKQYWHITASTSIILASITSILHWYEKEFKRLQAATAEPSPFQQYYEAMARFLQPMHLKARECQECGRVYRSKSHLLSHMHLEHNAPIPFQCDYCERKFVYESMKRHHENRHTLKEYHACKHCEYRAPNKTDLQIHMTMHSNVRAYICDICGASYKSSTSFNVHKRTHGEPRFKCERCGKPFYEKYRFKCHMQLHAMENTPLTCEYCKMEFPTRFAVKEHIKTDHSIYPKQRKMRKTDLYDEQCNGEELDDLDEQSIENEFFVALSGDDEVVSDCSNSDVFILTEKKCDYCVNTYFTTHELLTHMQLEHSVR